MLQELRIKKGLNQKDVAKLLKVSCTTVSYWETQRRCPSLKYVDKLANIYDVSAAVIVSIIITMQAQKGGCND